MYYYLCYIDNELNIFNELIKSIQFSGVNFSKVNIGMHYPHSKSSPEHTVICKYHRVLKRNTMRAHAPGKKRGANSRCPKAAYAPTI